MKSATDIPFLKVTTVLEMVMLSRSQLYKMMASGTFPGQIQLSGRAVAWRRTDIEEWIANRQPVKPLTLMQKQAKRSLERGLLEQRWKKRLSSNFITVD